MFVAIYRWRLKPGAEAHFEQGWRRITLIARERCGSFGSSLFREPATGHLVAIACWPDRAARDACFASGSLDPLATQAMRESVAEAFPDRELALISAEWALPTTGGPASL